MARPLPSGKPTVSLASDGPRVSRIRRDPPPKAPEIVVAERNERDARMVAIGIITFALALAVIGIAIMSWVGWSPRNYRLDV